MQTLLEASAKEATAALARLVGDPPPPVNIARFETHTRKRLVDTLPPQMATDDVVAVGFGIGGGVDGALMLLCQKPDALRLVARLMVGHTGRDFDNHARSAVSEVGNIIASAFLNQIANAMGRVVLPTPPRVAIGQLNDVTDELTRDAAQQGRPLNEWIQVGAELELDHDFSFAFDLVLLPSELSSLEKVS